MGENERANIARAIIEFEKNTCIRVIPRTTETDYVSIFRGSGCWSYLGKVGGKQELSLKKGCAWSVGTPIHELMHAIGYKHEQSRSDRDNFVEIKWDNIKDGKEGNFRKCTSCDLQGLPYDIGSVMHYHARAFAKDPSKPTIVPLNGVGIRNIGQRNGFSDSDIEGINKLYCNNIISVCSNDLPCLNGGTCVYGSCSCPSGITGFRCEIVACYSSDTTYTKDPVRGMKNFHIKGIKSLEDCQEECVKDPDCNFFTWNSPDFWKTNRRNTCWLKAGKGIIKQECGKSCTGKISGTKICDDDNQGYAMLPNRWCLPNQSMTATTLNDAAKECSDNPECHMFYANGEIGFVFRQRFMACGKGASVYYGSMPLYQKRN